MTDKFISRRWHSRKITDTYFGINLCHTQLQYMSSGTKYKYYCHIYIYIYILTGLMTMSLLAMFHLHILLPRVTCLLLGLVQQILRDRRKGIQCMYTSCRLRGVWWYKSILSKPMLFRKNII